MNGKIGLVSILSHFILPLVSSVAIAWAAPEYLDWLVLAVWTSMFALYQYLIDPLLLRDKLPTIEYYEFSLYIVIYSLLNALGAV